MNDECYYYHYYYYDYYYHYYYHYYYYYYHYVLVRDALIGRRNGTCARRSLCPARGTRIDRSAQKIRVPKRPRALDQVQRCIVARRLHRKATVWPISQWPILSWHVQLWPVQLRLNNGQPRCVSVRRVRESVKGVSEECPADLGAYRYGLSSHCLPC